MADNDGIDEALEGAIRLALITAARIGSELITVRAEQLRRAQALDEQAARRTLARHEAERRVAVAELAPVYRPGWWDSATPEQISKVYRTATAWAEESPEAQAALQRVDAEVRERFGIDVPTLIRRGEEERAIRVEGAVQAAAQERAADPSVAHRGFSYGYFDAQTDGRSSRTYTKEEALEVIAGTSKTITLADVEKNWNGPYLHEWFGVDPDVDRAIADRLPQLIPARYFGTEPAASEPGQEEGRTGAAAETRAERAAARGVDGGRYATVLAEHLGEDSTAAITRSPAWPALVSVLSRAEEAGHDVPNLVREITTDYERALDDAQDNAAVLKWRAEQAQSKREPELGAPATTAAEEQRREQVEADTLAAAAAAEVAAAAEPRSADGTQAGMSAEETLQAWRDENVRQEAQLNDLVDGLRRGLPEGTPAAQSTEAGADGPRTPPADAEAGTRETTDSWSEADMYGGLTDAEVQAAKQDLQGLDNAAFLQFAAEAGLTEAEAAAVRGVLDGGPAAEPMATEPTAGIAAAEQVANQGPRWDTPERREATAAAMTDSGLDPEVVAVRMRADTASAAPAAEATAGAGPTSRAPKASIDRGVEAAVEVIVER